MTDTTINPYRRIFSSVLESIPDVIDRMAWDVRPASRRSRRALRSVRSKYSGQTAVIMCNGPSLNKVDFQLLNGVFTFGLNKINLLFERTDFRPDAIVSINRHVIEQNRDFFSKTDIPLFLSSKSEKLVVTGENVIYLHTAHQKKFATDVSMSVAEGGTVTYVALQLAFHLGFQRVGLVGCDHSFASAGRANSSIIAGAVDKDHFDPRYFSNGVTWQLPDLDSSEIAYILARSAFAAAGRELVNCTVGGRLDVFPRRTLCEFIAGE